MGWDYFYWSVIRTNTVVSALLHKSANQWHLLEVPYSFSCLLVYMPLLDLDPWQLDTLPPSGLVSASSWVYMPPLSLSPRFLDITLQHIQQCVNWWVLTTSMVCSPSQVSHLHLPVLSSFYPKELNLDQDQPESIQPKSLVPIWPKSIGITERCQICFAFKGCFRKNFSTENVEIVALVYLMRRICDLRYRLYFVSIMCQITTTRAKMCQYSWGIFCKLKSQVFNTERWKGQ